MRAVNPEFYFNGILVYHGYQLPRAKSEWLIAICENQLVLPANFNMIVTLKWEFENSLDCIYAWLLYCKSQYNRDFVFAGTLGLCDYEEYKKKYYVPKEEFDYKRIKEQQRLARLFDYHYD